VADRQPETVTVLFTDVVGSTAFRDRVGDGHADHHLLELERASHHIVRERGGVVVKGLGDGIMATFSSAAAALDSAVALQEVARRLSRMGGVRLRVGVSSGDMVREGTDWHGIAAAEASRLCAEAVEGSVLASATTVVLARGRTRYEPQNLGQRHLRGFTAPIDVFELRPLDDNGVPAALARSVPAKLVGRSSHIAAGEEMLTAVAAGAFRSLLIVGEAGVGKTSLAAAIGQAAAALDFVVVFGHCDEGVCAPYQPVIEAIGSWLEACPDVALGRVLGDAGSQLVRLWPGLVRRVPGLTSQSDAEPETERWRLFDAVVSLTAVMAGEVGLLLVIDDLHWAEPATVALLRHLSDAGAPRVGVLATAREGDGDDDAGFVFDRFGTGRKVRRLSLTGLDTSEVGEFIALHAGEVPPHEFSRWLRDETGGNPFFLGALLTHLAEAGSLRKPDGEWLTGLELDEMGIPSEVRGVVERRLVRLEPPQLQAVAAAAVIGQTFEVAIVASVVGFGLDETIDALDKAVKVGVLREHGPGRLGFVHALVRHAVVANLSLTRLARLHWRVAEEIERTAGDVSSRRGEVAYHYAAGGDVGEPASIVRSAIAAGDDALRRLAFEDAAHQFRNALDALGRMPVDPETRFHVLISLADALNALTMPDAAQPLWLEAADLARRRRDPDGLFVAVHGFTYLLPIGPNPNVDQLLDDLLELSPPGDSAIRARALGLKASYGSRRDGPLAAEALAMARRTGDAVALAAALASMLILQQGSPDAAAMLATAEELYQTRKALDEPRGGTRPWVTRNLVWARFRLGRRADAERTLEDYRHQASQSRQGIFINNGLLWDAAIATAEGRFNDAERIAAEAQEHGGRHNAIVALGYGAQILAARMEQGAVDKVIDGLRRLDLRLEQLLAWRAMLAGALADTGQHSAAAIELGQLLKGDDSPFPLHDSAPLAVRYLAEVCRQLHDAAAARTLLPHVKPWAGQLLVVTLGTSIEGSSDRSIGHLLTTLGLLDEADAAYRSASQLELTAAFPPLAARTHYWHARMLLQRRGRDDQKQAAELLQDVMAVTRQFGMRHLGEQAASLFEALRASKP
jgi:class 3 adenylate cyclase